MEARILCVARIIASKLRFFKPHQLILAYNHQLILAYNHQLILAYNQLILAFFIISILNTHL